MTDKTEKPKTTQPAKEQGGRRQQPTKPWQKSKTRFDKKKDPEEIPVLKYGPANNFSKFKEAMSNAALTEYGLLGKLIKQGTIEKIAPKEPDVDTYGLDNDPYGVKKEKYLEDCKEHRKELHKMRENGPKLYGLITKYYGMRQGAYESIITYKERFDNAKKAYEDQKNPELVDKDVAMDFFRGLDDARYGSFKTDFQNQLTLQTIEQPENLNAMYLIANQWLKVHTKTTSSGYGTTFVTTLDHQEKPKRGKKNEKSKREESSQCNEAECFWAERCIAR